MEPRDLQPASYRGVFFYVSAGSIAGGRKTATKQFANSDLQVVEDLGKKQRDFSVSAVVAARRSASGTVLQTYKEVRDALLAALEKKGPGVLVHPFYGRIENVVVVSFSLAEDMTALGDAKLDIQFAISNADGLPEPSETVLGSVLARASAAASAAGANVSDNFSITDSFMGNFADGIEKISAIAAVVRSASTTFAAGEEDVDAFNRLLDGFEGGAVPLASDPTRLGNSLVGLVTGLSTLHGSSRETFGALSKLFTFGDGDVTIPQNTAGRIERKRNRDALNSSTQALALARAYEAAAQIDFETVDEVNDTSESLEAQYQKLTESGTLDDVTQEEINLLRVDANAFFDAQRDVKPRIVEVQTQQTSARLLSFQYYGTSERGDEIAKLNELPDSTIEQGTVRVLTA